MLVIIFSCNKKDDTAQIDRKDYDKAHNYYISGKKDSAFKYFNRAKDNFIEEKNFSFAGSCLVYMAIIQNNYEDYYGSQETSLSAIQYLNEKEDSNELSSNYNNLGIVFQNLKNYDRAAIYYNQAAKFSQKSLDSLTHLNNKAVALSYSKKFDSAISLFDKILAFRNLKKDSLLYSQVYDNRAYTKFLQNKKYNAEKELIYALEIRQDIKDNLGLNASFSHLSDYFEDKDPRRALFYSQEMFKIASKLNRPDDKLSALKKITYLANPESTKTYFKKYQDLNDSLQTSRNRSKNQFAFERYGSEKLKRENLEKDNNILKLLIGGVILIVVFVFIIIGYRKRQIRLKQEKELEIKDTQLKMSKKVHDVVANGIYQVMTKIENQEHFDRDRALDELEFVYEKSRDISYDKADDEQEFSKRISELIASFNNATVKTYTAGNTPLLWEAIPPPAKEEVYQIIRELMVNMKKHSNATNVAFRFEKINNSVDIQYKDNGIGISGDLIYNNGLRNTASRIEAINGSITFDTKIEKGLKVNLSVPAS